MKGFSLRLSTHLCITAGLVLLLIGAFSPQEFGISLNRFDGRYSLFTDLEITVFRGAFALSGILLITASVAWLTAGSQSSLRKYIESDYVHFIDENAASGRKYNNFIRFWSGVNFIIFMALVYTMNLSHEYHGKNVLWYNIIALENGVWETLTAVSLFAAGILMILAVKRFGKGFRFSLVGLPTLLFGVLLIAGAGEEISWGQHWIGFETPDFLFSVNSQEEFNIHNINSHFFNHIQVIFFLLYTVIFPILAQLFLEVRYFFDRLLLPLCPLAFVPFAVAGVLMGDHASLSGLWGNPRWGISEARETLFGIIILGTAIQFYLNLKTKNRNA